MLFVVAEVDIREWRTIWQCLHNVFFSTFASSLMTMRSYMQFITVILLQQIFWMQGKKKMARTLSECSCKFSFLLNPIFFFWIPGIVSDDEDYMFDGSWSDSGCFELTTVSGLCDVSLKKSYYCSILEHTCACIGEKDVFFRILRTFMKISRLLILFENLFWKWDQH